MSRRSRRQRLPAEPVEISVRSLSHEGRGVGEIDGKVSFVSGALPEETVRARFTNRRRQFDELQTLEVLRASPDRVTPPCRFAEVCGGCSMQHLAPSAQLAFKESVLFEHLSHLAGLEREQVELLPRLTGPAVHYRRKARLAVRVVSKKGGALVGFREKHSSFITDMDDCQVLVSEVANLLPALRVLINGLNAGREIPQIEVAAGERGIDADSLQVALVFRHLVPLLDEDLSRLLQFGADYDIQVYLQPGKPESVTRLYPEDGVDRLQYFLPEQECSLSFHPMDFTQINGDINRRIVNRTMQLLELSKEDRVLDLFCGLGNFTIPAARQAGSVVGVEGSPEMVERGGENAARNGLQSVRFHAADLTQSIKGLDWAQQSYDKIILDPPRSGALEIINEIANLSARRIVYVSCNPVTLARDTKHLTDAGYKLKSIGVMDMFPHTAHVESMAVFDAS